MLFSKQQTGAETTEITTASGFADRTHKFPALKSPYLTAKRPFSF
jgi:hypothetical protein